jgi:DegV family protein with EDD domain
MKQVRVVTDSVSDIPASLAAELGIYVIPCQVYFGQEVYRDGIDLSPKEFYTKLAASSELPQTSQPPVSRFFDTYQQILAAEPETKIVSIHVPSNLSGVVNAAWAAAQMLPEPSLVEVIDSGQISMGMGWAVIEAARMAQTGASQEQVSQHVRETLPHLRTAAMIDTLNNLHKGGRISQVSAVLGTALQIKPLLSIGFGQVSVWGKVRTRARALKRLAAEVKSWGTLAGIAVLHTGAEELAQTLLDQLQDVIPTSGVLIIPAGSALTTHLGLGAVGVCALVANKSQ